MFSVPNQYRIRGDHPLASTDDDGNNGAFSIPYRTSTLYCIASDGGGWEHVSVHAVERIAGQMMLRVPTWAEMCHVKDTFWGAEDCVVQYHPPRSRYVNCHRHVLHLWRLVGMDMPQPHPIMVGPLKLSP